MTADKYYFTAIPTLALPRSGLRVRRSISVSAGSPAPLASMMLYTYSVKHLNSDCKQNLARIASWQGKIITPDAAAILRQIPLLVTRNFTQNSEKYVYFPEIIEETEADSH